MKKVLLSIAVLMLGIVSLAQHLETTIKIVNEKARIAVKAVGGSVTGYPSNYVLVVAIPKVTADNGVALDGAVKLDPVHASANPINTVPAYSDGRYKYFLLVYTGVSSSPDSKASVFEDGVEYDIIELNWSGPSESFPVSLISLPDGNPGSTVAPSQWQQYLEIGGAEVSKATNYFYQSATSYPPIQAINYSTGIASVTTKLSINTKPSSVSPNSNAYNALAIGGLYPNPARDKINVIINAPQKDNVTLIVTDLLGQKVKQQLVNVETGANTVPVDIANLAQGSYMVKVLCKTSDCETATGKFNKQ